jgi:3',5'-cyclic AMP phosphodiesterase CpdA
MSNAPIPPPPFPSDRTRLRRALNQLLITDDDFEAFCIDWFPDVFRRLSSGMDRVQKTNLLLELQDPAEIWSALAKTFPEKQTGTDLTPRQVAMSDIFSPSRWPEHTFVEPAQLPELRMRLSSRGEGLVVEGPSGVGKTTAVRQALRQINQEERTRWLDMDAAADRSVLDDLLRSELGSGGYLVIDNFHHLDSLRQREVAVLIKRLSDQNRRDAKVTLIGINPVSRTLIDTHPDIMGRYARIAMGRQPEAKLQELIHKGEAAAKIEFVRRAEFVAAADGLFILAQRLCLEAALFEGVTMSQTALRRIEVGPQQVADRVLDDLRPKFQAPLLALAAHDVGVPPRGACLKLLWHLGRNPEAAIGLDELRFRDPQLRSAFEWLMASNLGSFFDANPRLGQLFFYDRRAAVLSAEDPQLAFYLRHLSWPQFADQSGYVGRVLRWDEKEGPILVGPVPVSAASDERPDIAPSGTNQPSVGTEPAATSSQSDRSGQRKPKGASGAKILHLSDLHFGPIDRKTLTAEQEPHELGRLLQYASRLYGQLEADLMRMDKRDGLNMLVVTGDIADRADPLEYRAAAKFLDELMRGCALRPHQVVLVPGNHDVDWKQAMAAYTPMRRSDVRRPLEKDTYIDDSPDGSGKYIEVRNESEHQKRFLHFSNFYSQVRPQELYPLDYSDQALLQHFPEQNVLVLGLNSAWRIDHHFSKLASINPDALEKTLKSVRNTPAYRGCVKIAAWHHPIHSDAEDRIKDSAFLQQLATHGFQLVLHGHVHASTSDVNFSYKNVIADREIQLVSAGTFGSRDKGLHPGIPLQYQVLEVEGHTAQVFTRKREKADGAWTADARWVTKDAATGKEVWDWSHSLRLSDSL